MARPQLKRPKKRRPLALGRRIGGLSRAASRDANEPEIIEALHRVGADVFQLDGRDIPDLLVGFRDRWVLLEVKTPDGDLRPGQETFLMLAEARRRPAFVVRNPEDALRAIGVLS